MYVFFGGSEAAWTAMTAAADTALKSTAAVHYNAADHDWQNTVPLRSCSVCGTAEMPADAQSCGDNLKWVLQDGTLIIAGTGAMEDYVSVTNNQNTFLETPWESVKDSINMVYIYPGVTTVGAGAFKDCKYHSCQPDLRHNSRRTDSAGQLDVQTVRLPDGGYSSGQHPDKRR